MYEAKQVARSSKALVPIFEICGPVDAALAGDVVLATTRPPKETAMAIALDRSFLRMPLDTECSRLNDALTTHVSYLEDMKDS